MSFMKSQDLLKSLAAGLGIALCAVLAGCADPPASTSYFPLEIRHSHKPVTMRYRIEALDDALATRAGSFKHCIRVQGQAVLKLFVDPVGGMRNMPIRTAERCCKDAGLVKVVRAKPAKSSFLMGGTQSLELIEWQ